MAISRSRIAAGPRALALCLLACATLPSGRLCADPVAVRYAEGVVHGFLTLSALDGTQLAVGDLLQVSRGGRVTSRLLFRFRDGSLLDETAVFSQRGRFRLLTDHLVQKGPAFPQPMDVAVDTARGTVTVRATVDGKETSATEQIRLPADLANGLIPILLKNVESGLQHLTLSMVAATPKVRLVKLQIANTGEEPFTLGGAERRAIHYVVKVEIGGIAGLVAPLVGKQPVDSHVWILPGDIPAFVRSEGPLYNGGPVWRIDLASPAWKR